MGSHEEYATPECRSIFEAVCWDKAGQRLLQNLVDDLGLREAVSFHNNSVDHFGGHTFGCHENYLSDRRALSGDRWLPDPFLVTARSMPAPAGWAVTA